jgi:hypothetical protein
LNVGTTRFEFCACKELLAYWQIAIFLGFGRKRITSHPHFMVCNNLGCKMLGAKRTPVKPSNPERLRRITVRAAQTRSSTSQVQVAYGARNSSTTSLQFTCALRCLRIYVRSSRYLHELVPRTHDAVRRSCHTPATAKPKVCNRVDDRPIMDRLPLQRKCLHSSGCAVSRRVNPLAQFLRPGQTYLGNVEH